MRWLMLAACLFATPAFAQWGGQSNTLNAINPQVLPVSASPGLPAIDDNLAGGSNTGVAFGICAEYGHQVPCSNHYSITRASVKYCQAKSLNWHQALSGMACATNNGLLIEEARTNDALWARDLTQSGAWTAVGMGSALNAVGIDGTANSATTLTANGTAGSCTASCTILQTITLGSSADTYSVWLKRVSGSGAVNITINNLSGVTACTLTTTAFTRCSVTATLANPVFGIQMTGLNDVIVADGSQLEPGAFATSPIFTTTVAATRAADLVTAAGSLLNLILSKTFSVVASIAGSPNGSTGRILSGNTDVNVLLPAGSSTYRSILNSVTLTATLGSGTVAAGPNKIGLAMDAVGRSLVGNNGTVVSDTGNFLGSNSSISIGTVASGTQAIDTTLLRLSPWSVRFPDATFKALTQ